MAIKKRLQAFTLIEVLVSMMIFGFLFIGSLTAYSKIVNTSKMNEMRYLMLNKIDSEMSRLVFANENLNRSQFCSVTSDNGANWSVYNKVDPGAGSDDQFRIYANNPLHTTTAYGLHIHFDSQDRVNNIINIYDQTTDLLKEGSIVGLLAWKIEDIDSNTAVNLSLSITYPYIITNIDNDKIDIQVHPDFTIETLNLKTSTKIKSNT